MATGKILLIGADGMFGRDMMRLLSPCRDIAGADINEVDISNAKSVDDFVTSQGPDIVINAAGYTNVDGCEKNTGLAFSVNAKGPGNIAHTCRKLGIPLAHISTDFVFDGTKSTPYSEEDLTNPISKYAESKLAGEASIQEAFDDYLIIRTTWLFGFHDKSFVRFVLKKAAEGGAVPVFSEQRACPTYTLDLAEGIMALLDKGARGIYHFVNSSNCNRLEFVNEIFDIMGYDKSKIQLMESRPATWIAKRPAVSILSTAKYSNTKGREPRSWQQALRDCLEKDT